MDRVDIHCHLLPGLDDGPEGVEEALDTAERAVADGTSTIVCSTHFDDRDLVTRGSLRDATAALQSTLRQHSLPLTLITGAEVLISPTLPERAASGLVPTIGDGPYLLIEFPFFVVPGFADRVVFELLAAGLRPILGHPERCRPLSNAPDRLADLVERGLLVQINAGSLTGEHGREARNAARTFLSRGLVHVIASDGHSSSSRPPLLSDAQSEAAAIVGPSAAAALVTSVPRAIVEGNDLPAIEVSLPEISPPRRLPFRLPFRR